MNFNNDKKPLVSCIMPTHDRTKFISQAIKYFLRQDYPNRELIIIDDSVNKIKKLIPEDERICYIEISQSISTGESRNIAIENSNGEIIAHWDDDDWYGKNRLSYQILPILNNKADITGVNCIYFFDVNNNQFWIISDWLHKQIIDFEVHGGTMMYRKKLWTDFAKFPHVSFQEDPKFMAKVMKYGARLLSMPNYGSYVYIRHKNNTWRFNCGQFGNPSGWRKIAVPEFFTQEDLSFYSELN